MGIRPARISLCLRCAGLAARLYGLVYSLKRFGIIIE